MGRTAAWNAIYSSRMSNVEFATTDQNRFDAELRIGQIGPVKLARLSVDCNYSAERARRHIVRNAPRLYNFLLQAQGSSTFHHCGHEARLSEGDIVLVDTGLPHHFVTDDVSTTIMVRVPSEVLREYLPTPEQFCGLQLGRAIGLTGTLAAMVQSLSERVEPGFSGYEGRVARYLLEMISMSYTMGFESVSTGSATLWQRRNEIVRYVEDNLRDPELTPASIAAALRLSPRYLRTVFSISGEKVSAYILRRRLEECARQMRNRAWNGHTLTEIAFSWGFNSAAHFTRCFRDQFGAAPRDYRRTALD
ncbi:helix-turn-helix domain-containing protein [Sphingomonas canadensis]|nr:helix-turn-helix domain-containing protein [Sphingomonas canadensis]